VDVVWIQLPQAKFQWWAFVNVSWTFGCYEIQGAFLLSRRTQLHAVNSYLCGFTSNRIQTLIYGHNMHGTMHRHLLKCLLSPETDTRSA
jgi:hypothetical protein